MCKQICQNVGMKLTLEQRAEMLKMHFEKGISQTELAKIYGVTRELVGRYCRQVGASPLRKFYQMNDEEIIRLYIEEDWQLIQIARHFKVDRNVIRKRLIWNKVSLKDPNGWKKRYLFRKTPSFFTKHSKWKKEIKERDNNKCRWCQSKENVESHHIIPVRRMKSIDQFFELNNGISLCQNCHKKVHYREKMFEKFFLTLISTGSV